MGGIIAVNGIYIKAKGLPNYPANWEFSVFAC